MTNLRLQGFSNPLIWNRSQNCSSCLPERLKKWRWWWTRLVWGNMLELTGCSLLRMRQTSPIYQPIKLALKLNFFKAQKDATTANNFMTKIISVYSIRLWKFDKLFYDIASFFNCIRPSPHTLSVNVIFSFFIVEPCRFLNLATR